MTNLQKLLFFIFLVLPLSFVFSQDEIEKEFETEKSLEQRITSQLNNFLKPDEYVLIVDLKRITQKEKYTLPGMRDEMSDLTGQLPGIPQERRYETGQAPEYQAPSRSFSLENYKKSVILYLNKKLPKDRMNVVEAMITQAAQLDQSLGDQFTVKVVNLADDLMLKAKEEMQQKPTSSINNINLLIIGGIVLALIIFIAIFAFIFTRGKQTKAKEIITHAPQMQQIAQDTSRQQPTVSESTKGKDEAVKTINKELIKQEVINLAFSRPDLVSKVVSDWVKEENGLRQATSLVKSFGLDTIMNLFSEVDSQSKKKIFAYYSAVTDWKHEEEIENLDKFNNALIAQKFQALASEEGGKTEEEKHFSFINKLSDYQIYYLIKDENPKVIALLLSYLPPEKSAKLLAQLNPKQKSVVCVELGNINYINVDVIAAITKRLAEKSLMIPKFEFYPGSGVSSLVSILDHLDQTSEKYILDSIKQFDSELANKVKKAYFVFDDLANFTADALKTITADLPKSVLATSLVGASEKITSKILGILPERKREMLTFDIEKMKGASQTEITGAQKEFVTRIRESIKNGVIDLEKVQEKPPETQPQTQTQAQVKVETQKPVEPLKQRIPSASPTPKPTQASEPVKPKQT
jgi:flagellar motor switch protein FliG